MRAQIYLHKVLLVGGKEFTLVGAPILEDAIGIVSICAHLSFTSVWFFEGHSCTATRVMRA
jgi:ribosomal protein L21